jgi:hypothetical protein
LFVLVGATVVVWRRIKWKEAAMVMSLSKSIFRGLDLLSVEYSLSWRSLRPGFEISRMLSWEVICVAEISQSELCS